MILAVACAACSAGSGATPGERATLALGRTAGPDTKVIFDAYDFDRLGNDADGVNPYGGLYPDASGALYGTTVNGGISTFGTVYKLTRTGHKYTESILYAFNGNPDGQYPRGTLIADAQGVLYGTTQDGGGVGCSLQNLGCGTIFALTPTQSGYALNILYSFAGSPDGAHPFPGLVAYDGAFYGTTQNGGTYGYGTVYKLAPSGSGYMETVVHNFQSNDDGRAPVSALIVVNGTLYGTTLGMGDKGEGSSGQGVVFALTPSGTFSILHRFRSYPADGDAPAGTLLAQSGALYGTATQGGKYGFGMVFKIATSGAAYQDLYDFQGPPNDGWQPWAGLTAGKNGTFYGTTVKGGNGQCTASNAVVIGCGTLYELQPTGSGYSEQVLASFQGIALKGGGAFPYAGVIVDKNRAIYGTTLNGGPPESICAQGCGVVFELP